MGCDGHTVSGVGHTLFGVGHSQSSVGNTRLGVGCSLLPPLARAGALPTRALRVEEYVIPGKASVKYFP